MGWKVNRSVARLPIRVAESWDRDATEAGRRRYAGKGKDPKDWGAKEWRAYRLFFVVYNSDDPHKFESYKLPVGEVVNGRPVINSKALLAAYQALRGARGGVDIPEDVKDEAIRFVERLREKAERKGKARRQLRKVLYAYFLHKLCKDLGVDLDGELILEAVSEPEIEPEEVEEEDELEGVPDFVRELLSE